MKAIQIKKEISSDSVKEIKDSKESKDSSDTSSKDSKDINGYVKECEDSKESKGNKVSKDSKKAISFYTDIELQQMKILTDLKINKHILQNAIPNQKPDFTSLMTDYPGSSQLKKDIKDKRDNTDNKTNNTDKRENNQKKENTSLTIEDRKNIVENLRHRASSSLGRAPSMPLSSRLNKENKDSNEDKDSKDFKDKLRTSKDREDIYAKLLAKVDDNKNNIINKSEIKLHNEEEYKLRNYKNYNKSKTSLILPDKSKVDIIEKTKKMLNNNNLNYSTSHSEKKVVTSIEDYYQMKNTNNNSNSISNSNKINNLSNSSNINSSSSEFKSVNKANIENSNEYTGDRLILRKYNSNINPRIDSRLDGSARNDGPRKYTTNYTNFDQIYKDFNNLNEDSDIRQKLNNNLHRNSYEGKYISNFSELGKKDSNFT